MTKNDESPLALLRRAVNEVLTAFERDTLKTWDEDDFVLARRAMRVSDELANDRNVRVVRVVMPAENGPLGIDRENGALGSLIECLRYCGLVTVHRHDENGMCFDILPPENVVTSIWAKNLAGKMESHGFNAVSAPVWADEGQEICGVCGGDGEISSPNVNDPPSEICEECDGAGTVRK